MERLVEGGRHVEVQVIADQHGNVWAPGVRDCSVQRRNQKVIEESSSPALTAEQDAALRESSMALVKAAGYVGAGTVEFLYQPEEKLFTFLEVNTRLQVEHPVTEETTGLDIVKLQLHVAAGGRLEGEPPREFGHAVEARLNAEDAEQGFAPAPGQVELLRLPTGPGRPRGHRHARRRRDPAGLRLDGRQDHRLGARPARGAGPAARRPARHHRRPPRRDDDEVLPARPARPARGRRAAPPTPAGWTAPAPAATTEPAPSADAALVQVAIDASDAEEARRARGLPRVGPRRPPAGAARGRPHAWSWATAARSTG